MAASEVKAKKRQAVGKRPALLRRLPWLWADLVAATRLPPWAAAVVFAVACYALLAGGAWAAGDAAHFVRDYRFVPAVLALAFASYLVGATPRWMERLWQSLLPRVASTDQTIQAFRRDTPLVLMRFFWPALAVWLVAMMPSSFAPQIEEGWFSEYPDPSKWRPLTIPLGLLGSYLLAGATSIATGGLGLWAHHLQRRIDLRRGIVPGGKGAFAPFNRLVLSVWATFTGPMILWLALSMATSPLFGWWLAPAAIIFPALLSTIFVPHLFINRLLAKEKAEELQALRAELAETSTFTEKTDAVDGMRRMVRTQVLLDQLQQARAFNPTLMDARFFIQVGTSMSGIVLANIFLRQLLS